MVFNPFIVPPKQSPGGFCSRSEAIDLQTTGAPQFVDITERVERALARSGLGDGLVVVFSRHTTAAITINENEPLLMDDMARFLERLAPHAAAYRHNDFTVRTVNMTADESPNGHAHCLQLVLGASQTIPVQDGRLGLGRWQRVFLVELDRARSRQVVVQAFGLARQHALPVQELDGAGSKRPRATTRRWLLAAVDYAFLLLRARGEVRDVRLVARLLVWLVLRLVARRTGLASLTSDAAAVRDALSFFIRRDLRRAALLG